jgi:hypothetical protein
VKPEKLFVEPKKLSAKPEKDMKALCKGRKALG